MKIVNKMNPLFMNFMTISYTYLRDIVMKKTSVVW